MGDVISSPTPRRRRGEALERAVLDAAAEQLAEGGYASMTIERVAARAGTNKNTIYRRWPDRLALGVAAYGRLATSAEPPDTGNLREDVLAALRLANRHWSSPLGVVLRDLFGAAAESGVDLPATLREFTEDGGLQMWTTILNRALHRGDVPSGALHPRVATVAIALLRHEFVLRGVPNVPDDVLVEITDAVYLPLVRTVR